MITTQVFRLKAEVYQSLRNARIKPMDYPAASREVSSSVLARHSVLDTPAPYWIRGNPVGPSGYRLPPV